MPVEQGLPWHPVATGLVGQAIQDAEWAISNQTPHSLHEVPATGVATGP